METILKMAAQYYGIAASELSPLPGGHFSHVYGFHRDGQDYVLRITPPNEEIGFVEMQAILTWMHALTAHDAPVAGPILSKQGQLIERVVERGKPYLLVAFPKAQGIRGEELAFEQWTDALYMRLGQTLGKLHTVAQTYTPPNPTLRRPMWDKVGNCYNETSVPDTVPPVILEKRQAVVDYVQTLPKDKESYGLIHADFHGGNFFVDTTTNTITVFDFDDCVYGWYSMDIAMSVFDALVLYTGSDKSAFATHFLGHYLRGYLSEKSLDRFWAAQIPYFLKLLETNIYLQVAPYHSPEDTDSWVGSFMQDRERRIVEDIAYVDVDFAALLEKVQQQMR